MNMTRFCVFFALLFFNFQTVFSSTNYSMQVTGTKILNDSTISFEVYLKSTDTSFQMTSYQCILCLNNNSPIYKFSYVEGSSELNNLTPSIGVGVIDTDGEAKMTFASLPGTETITTKELKVGDFILKTHIDSAITTPEISWCFDGKISTILTGNNFDDITNNKEHFTFGNNQLIVLKITASSTTQGSTEYLTDGKGLLNSEWNEAWTSTTPSYLIFDLGSEQEISSTRFEFNNWNKGRIFQYSIYTSNDTINWKELISDASSDTTEWTVNNFNNQYARYVKLLITGNNQNEYATLWEAQIYGLTSNYSATGVVEKQKVPAEYSLSQNYPNPFNPSTKINFTLGEAGKVSLEVYNILGEKVSTLINGDISAGQHEVNFNAANLASGIYIYRINVNNKFADTKKMILMK